MKQITLVLSTARKERQSEKVFSLLARYFNEHSGAELSTVDVRDHVLKPETIPPWGPGGASEKPTEWLTIVEKTDAFVFVLPEYNHGYPGEWKLLVDSVGAGDYNGKHAFIAGVSSGIFSGVRVADHVKPILVELMLIPHKTALYTGNVEAAFDESGNLTDEKARKRALTFVDEVIKVA